MKLSCSAYQAGSSYAQKILSGHTQNYGATSSTNSNPSGDSSHGITMPTWTVEEIEGKCSPNETEFGADGPGGYQQQSGAICGGETSRTGESSGGGGRGESSRRTSSSLSHHSDGHPDQKGNQSDSTSISKAPATSSCSPSDSPAHRLSEHSRSRSKSVGEQQWTNLRAVVAWYARLRRIKRSKSNQRWMKLRTTVQLSGAIQTIQQKKAPLKREDSFLKRFSTRQIPEAQETFEIGDDDGPGGGGGEWSKQGRKKRRSLPRSVVNPDGNFYFYWLMLLTFCVLYNLWTLIVRQSFPELQAGARLFWILADSFSDLVFLLDIAVQFRTGYLEQGLMVFQTKKLANHYVGSKPFYLDLFSLLPTDLFQLYFGINPMFRFPRFLKVYRIYNYYYMVESRTVYPNVWRVVNLIHILLLLAHWFGCFYYLLSQAEGFQGYWGYPDPSNPDNKEFATLTRKYLGSLYWSTLTLTTIGDLPPPNTNWQEDELKANVTRPIHMFSLPAYKSRLHYISSNTGFLFTIVSYLIGVFIFATIVGQVGNVITNRNANRLEFERLLDGAKMYMRHHKVPRDMQRRVLRWYDYSWSRGRIQGGGDINTALGLLPDKLKTELALHVNLSVLKKVTIFQECQPEFLHDLVLKMKAYIFTPGDLICRKGEVAREMFIIADGILEVISETGKVLTTMEAGDFFGEIGILNLDGLNKRTADVRSVGYSELFSLSREDVLAAMKDYPEAQEILQTLGRKRLMEARKASGPATKKTGTSASGGPGAIVPVDIKKGSPINVGLTHNQSYNNNEAFDASGPVMVDTTAGKRIVEKLRCDVKGLRNAIRRSRKSNSSKEDSSEPETEGQTSSVSKSRKESTSSVRDVKSFPPPRGVLKRMHNISVSDEKDKEPSTSPSTSTSSPSMKSVINAARRVQLPKIPVAQPEVIGAGLPLIQRLRLLKQKEEREKKQQDERDAMMKTLIPTNLSLQSPNVSPILHTKASVETMPMSKTTDPATALANVVERTRAERASVSSNDSGSTISSPPSTSLPLLGTFSPKSTLLIGEAAAVAVLKVTAEPIPIGAGSTFPPVWTASPPRSIVTPSAVQGDQMEGHSSSVPTSSCIFAASERPSALQLRQQHAAKNYGSVDDLSPEFSRLPFIKKLKILNERQKIAELLLTKSANSVLTRSTSEGSNENPSVPGDQLIDIQLHSVQLGRRTQSNREQIQADGDDSSETSISSNLTQQQHSPVSTDVLLQKLQPIDLAQAQTGISSTLSPTKISTSTAAEIMTKAQTHDLQIDANAKIASQQDSSATDCLTLSSQLSSNNNSSTPKSRTKVKKRRKATKKLPENNGNDGSTEDSSPSPSPPMTDADSNETPERRNLKSILKKLAETSDTVAGDPIFSTSLDERQLLKAPTAEGYAARHRKFSKNVTFRRQAVTVVSPEGLHTADTATPISAPELSDHSTRVTTTLTTQSHAIEGQSLILTSRPISPENLKTLTNLLMMKGIELDDDSEHQLHPPIHYQGLNIAQEECIGSVVLGIKTIIQSKIDEIQTQFRTRFDSLEHEVRRRDDIICILQQRIQELENRSGGEENFPSINQRDIVRSNHVKDNNGHTLEFSDENDESDVEYQRSHPLHAQSSYLFSRGDSIDTVISAQDFDDEVFERSEALYESNVNESQEQGNDNRNSRQSRETGGGIDRSNYISSWAQDQDTIEMSDMGPAPWQLEFHRDRDSLPPPNGTKGESVAVDIGNTSTEYESTSSDEDHGAVGGVESMGKHIQLQERKVKLDDDTDEDDDFEANPSDSDDSENSINLNNKNWEIQLLAKEMEKQEEKQQYIPSDDVVVEMRELEDEIAEMKDAVNTGSLSPSELDMLESILQSKTKRMKALYKALSVESAAAGPSQDSSKGSPKSKVGRSYDDFRRGSGGSSTEFQATVIPNISGKIEGESTNRSILEVQKLFSRKPPTTGLKRQSSLYERARTNFSSQSSSDRRESAGAIFGTGNRGDGTTHTHKGTKKHSFFSRFSVVRQLTLGRHGTQKSFEDTCLHDQIRKSSGGKADTEEEIESSISVSQTISTIGVLPIQSSSSNVQRNPSNENETEIIENMILASQTTQTVAVATTSSTDVIRRSGEIISTISSEKRDSVNRSPLLEESQPLLK